MKNFKLILLTLLAFNRTNIHARWGYDINNPNSDQITEKRLQNLKKLHEKHKAIDKRTEEFENQIKNYRQMTPENRTNLKFDILNYSLILKADRDEMIERAKEIDTKENQKANEQKQIKDAQEKIAKTPREFKIEQHRSYQHTAPSSLQEQLSDIWFSLWHKDKEIINLNNCSAQNQNYLKWWNHELNKMPYMTQSQLQSLREKALSESCRTLNSNEALMIIKIIQNFADKAQISIF